MITWSNWSGRHRTDKARLHFVRSEADAAALAAATAADGGTLRVAGSGHSHMPLIPNDHVIADLSGLSGVISTDPEERRAWVWAGTPIYALGRPLHDVGLALHNQGDIDRQTIAGATGTGTHGTGLELGNLSSIVTGARIALASGELVDCGPQCNAELWQAARLSLGALGVATRLELALCEAYRLSERSERIPYEELVPTLGERTGATRHFEFFWRPHSDEAFVKTMSTTLDEPSYPIDREGERKGWSYEVLPSHRDWPHTEMEYSIPAEHGPECLAAIRHLLRNDFPDMPWPVEYRGLAADNVWLSTAYERPTVTISLHQAVEEDEEPMFRAAETIFRSFDGRPHWGKVNYLDGRELANIHPRWADWWSVRDRIDPNGTFLNEYLRTIRATS